MAYLICYTGNFTDFSVTPNATAPAPEAPEGTTVILVASEDDLYRLVKSGPEMVALYNAVGNDPVLHTRRFKDRRDGARRTFGLIARLYPETPAEAAAPSTVEQPGAANPEEGEDMASKKSKKAKGARPKAKKAATRKVGGGYKAEVASSGGTESKAKALEMIQRAKGATPEEIADKLGVSKGTAKNLIWYLRRDGEKIVLGEKSGDRRPYVVG